MILGERYPHIFELVSHYAVEFEDELVKEALNSGIHSDETAKAFSYFIWKMVDQIHVDYKSEKFVLHSKDNRSMLPDLNYEVDTYMESCGYLEVWKNISNSI